MLRPSPKYRTLRLPNDDDVYLLLLDCLVCDVAALSDRLKSEVALCGEHLELSMIHDTWKPAHGIPASGTCICHVSSGKENWNNICVHTDIGPTVLSSRHRRKFVAFVSKSGNITSVFQFASVQTEFAQ